MPRTKLRVLKPGLSMLVLALAVFAGCSEKKSDPARPPDDSGPTQPTGPVPASLAPVTANFTANGGAAIEVAARLSTATNDAVPGVPIQFSVASGAGSITAGATTDASGIARATWTLPGAAGTYKAQAAVNWSSGDRSFNSTTGFTAEVKPPPPPALPALAPVVLAAGGGHACYIELTGQAICWGTNGAKELGTAGLWPTQFSIFRTPVEVQQGATKFVEIAAGETHTCALDDTGHAWCWGRNTYGQVGDGSAGNELDAPTAVTGGLAFARIVLGQYHTCGLTTTGQAYCWGGNFTGQLGNDQSANSSVPMPVAGNHLFADLAAGLDRSCGIDTDGQAFCWGGVGNQFVRVPTAAAPGLRFFQIAVTAGHACGRADDGKAWCWGTNTAGQLGNGTTTNSQAPVEVAGGHTFKQLVVGHQHTCGIDSQDQALCWGTNTFGQLGDGSAINSPVPVPVSGNSTFTSLAAAGGFNPNGFTCGIENITPGFVVCWGSNNNGQLGNGPQSSSSVPVRIAGDLQFNEVAAGVFHTCAIDQSALAWCWGNNSTGQLGSGDNVSTQLPVQVSGGIQFKHLSSGRSHTCGLTGRPGAAYCWGNNSAGALGDGTQTSTTSPVPVAGGSGWLQISAGRDLNGHTCGVDSNLQVWCWGDGAQGMIGNGATTTRLVPTRVNLTLNVTNDAVSGVVAGNRYSCAWTRAGDAFCWGYNQYGSLGTGDNANSSTPRQVAGGHHFSSLSASDYHICGIADNGSGLCWGRGINGELGQGSLDNSNVPVAVSGFNGSAGSGHFFQVATGGGEISANARGHACGIESGGQVWCWGYNNQGQLGDQSMTRELVPVKTAIAQPFDYISLGGQFSCGIGHNLYIYCWGAGSFGDGNVLSGGGQTTPRRIFFSTGAGASGGRGGRFPWR